MQTSKLLQRPEFLACIKNYIISTCEVILQETSTHLFAP